MKPKFFDITDGSGPVITTAIHNGHLIREEVAKFLALDEQSRIYEEDPYTEYLALISANRVIANYSRFELDLNREKGHAIYMNPEDAWGLKVWKKPLKEKHIQKSMFLYDQFYLTVKNYIQYKIDKYGYAIILDFHTYNYKRDNQEAPESENPDINIGTRGLNPVWHPLISTFMEYIGNESYPFKDISVEKNLKFKGGHFISWINKTFQDKACAIAIEIKKIFMDEKSGLVNIEALNAIKKIFRESSPLLRMESENLVNKKVFTL